MHVLEITLRRKRMRMQRGGLRVWRGEPAAGPKLFDLEASREVTGHTGPVTSVALDDE